MTFYVGQKITMSRPIPPWFERPEGIVLPEFGIIYTVRDLEVYDDSEWLRLDEIRNHDVMEHGRLIEPWFETVGFRPVVERKTDISVFAELLDTTKSKEPV
jgi:hypothetical protein